MRSFSRYLTIRRLSILVLKAFLFLQYRHIRIFVARTPYDKLPAIPADMPVEHPKEFHVGKETHVALIADGIGHAHVKVTRIRFPLRGQYFLEEINVKT